MPMFSNTLDMLARFGDKSAIILENYASSSQQSKSKIGNEKSIKKSVV